MTDYVDGIAKVNYIPNVIIQIAGVYLSIRQPDSGLTVNSRYNGTISRLNVSPTSIDPLRPSTTYSTSAFTVIDKGLEISKLFAGKLNWLTGQEVRVFLGRSNESMDFSEYLELPVNYVKKVQKIPNAYTFSTIEQKDRLDKGVFNGQSKLSVDIADNTTSITVQDVSVFSAPGFIKIDDEFISFTGVSGSNLTGCVRGEFGSAPVEHDQGATVFATYDLTSRNAIDFLLQLLISSGGGGSYDVLPDGAGISESLINVAQFESVRDEFFTGTQYNFDFRLYNIEKLQTFIENEIFLPLGVRIISGLDGKIALATLDRESFDVDQKIIDEDTTFRDPNFVVTDDAVSNKVRVFWNWNDARNDYDDVFEDQDDDSIALFGETATKEYRFKGVKSESLASSIAALYLSRFSLPRPSIAVDALNSASTLSIGDKVQLFSSKIPSEDGTLNFSSTLEVLKKAYNPITGTVNYALAFTSFSGIRQCYIAPSDLATSFVDAKTLNVAAGRGQNYRVGWKMRLFDSVDLGYHSAQVNTIAQIIDDQIIFEDDWTGLYLYLAKPDGTFILTPGGDRILLRTPSNNRYRMMFADYDEVSEQQKRFCFISDNGGNFSDGKKTYQISFS